MTQVLSPVIPAKPNWRLYKVTISTKRVVEVPVTQKIFDDELVTANGLNRIATAQGYFYFVVPA